MGVVRGTGLNRIDQCLGAPNKVSNASAALLSELVQGRLLYYPTVTREPYRNRGRLTDLMHSGKLFEDLGLPALDAAPGKASAAIM